MTDRIELADYLPAMISAAEVKSLAQEVGFDLCGITRADSIPEAGARLGDWLQNDMHGEMSYMARDPERRSDPERLLPDAKSLILLGMNYYQANTPPPENPNHSYGHVSRYARGRDYHEVIEGKHAALLKRISSKLEIAATQHSQFFRSYVDYGPVLERSHAVVADLGYLGKNSMLINRQFGSYLFLSAIVTTLELEPDQTGMTNHGRCGECRRCIDACPTDAIVADGVIDARRCISYLTIERPSEIPDNLADRMGDNLFGCDICQEVCPHNGRAVISSHPEFSTENGVGEWLRLDSIERIASDSDFRERFAGTPLLRTRKAGLERNAVIVQRNLKRRKGENGE